MSVENSISQHYIKSKIKDGLGKIALRALDISTYIFGTTTNITGFKIFDRFNPRHPINEQIRGSDTDKPHENKPAGFDTTRLNTIYCPMKQDDPQGKIYLHTTNLADHAVCWIDRSTESRLSYKDSRLVNIPIRVAINGKLQDATLDYPRWNIKQGDKLQAWVGGETFEERDQTYSEITVTWTPPPSKK